MLTFELYCLSLQIIVVGFPAVVSGSLVPPNADTRIKCSVIIYISEALGKIMVKGVCTAGFVRAFSVLRISWLPERTLWSKEHF